MHGCHKQTVIIMIMMIALEAWLGGKGMKEFGKVVNSSSNEVKNVFTIIKIIMMMIMIIRSNKKDGNSRSKG